MNPLTKQNKDLKVALFVGGWSVERQVSLEKGKAVELALREAGYDVYVIDVHDDLPRLIIQLEDVAPDVVFNNLHGKGGEDGTIQAVLEMLRIPYTHSGVCASAIAMDKPLSKQIAAQNGVNIADELLCTRDMLATQTHITPPYVIKPKDEGSSVGIYMVRAEGDNLTKVLSEDWPFGEEVMVEKYIPGQELTVAVLDGKAQAVTRIISEQDFFDYSAKYLDQQTTYELPADIPEPVYQKAMRDAEAVYKAIGCRGIARCDFRYDDSQGENGLYFLEINTQPGFTPESIGPSQVVYNGLTFVQLCSHLIEVALCTANEKESQNLPSAQNA